MIAGGMGALSINLAHLPHPGGITEQGSKMMTMFDIIKSAQYAQHNDRIKVQSGKRS